MSALAYTSISSVKMTLISVQLHMTDCSCTHVGLMNIFIDQLLLGLKFVAQHKELMHDRYL